MIKTILNSDLELFTQVVKSELEKIKNDDKNISENRIVTMQLPESKENTLFTFIVTKNVTEIETIKNFISSIR